MEQRGLDLQPAEPAASQPSGPRSETAHTPPDSCSRWKDAVDALDLDDQELLQPILCDKENRSSSADILADILQAAEQRKAECLKKRFKVTINGRDIVVRDVLDKISSWVSKFIAIGDTLIQIDPVHAAAPWAAVRLIMQTAVSDFQTFGFVLSSIERMANHISVCAVFEMQYLSVEQSSLSTYDKLSRAVTNLYKNMLQYLCTTIRYYKLGSVLRQLKSIVASKADMEEKYKPIDAAQATVNDLARLCDAEKANLALKQLRDASSTIDTSHKDVLDLKRLLQELSEPISRTSSHLEAVKDNLDRAERTRILKAISTINYSQHHMSARKGRLEGSGRWLMQKEAFKEWRCDSSSSALWLHGIPGSGKTTLTSLVIDELLGGSGGKLAYFYCVRSPAEPFRGQADRILASLARQLASVKPNTPLLPPAVSHYNESKNMFLDSEEATDHEWPVDAWESVLRGLLAQYDAVTIVIDALDEVQYQDRQQLLDTMGRLMKETPNLLKVFLSSRDNYDISLRLEGSPNVYIAASDNQQDIQEFVNTRLASARLLHGNLTDELRNQIIRVLTSRACGMFRWVELQIHSLVSLKVAADIVDRLGKLPLTLEESYWELYQRILQSGRHAAQLAVFTFQWLLFADHRLSVDGVAAIASTVGFSDVDGESGSKPAQPSQVSISEIIDVCENLVVIKDDTFQFAHLSVREFLEGLPQRQVEAMAPEAGNGAIAVAYLRYFMWKANLKLSDISKSFGKPAAESNPGELCAKAAAELSRDDGRAIDIAATRWPYFVSCCPTMRSKSPLRGLLRQVLSNDRKFGEALGAFRFWCYFVRSRQCWVGKEVRCCACFPSSPAWLAIMLGWDETALVVLRMNPCSTGQVSTELGGLQPLQLPYDLRLKPCSTGQVSTELGGLASFQLPYDLRLKSCSNGQMSTELGGLRPLQLPYEYEKVGIAAALVSADVNFGDMISVKPHVRSQIDVISELLQGEYADVQRVVAGLRMTLREGHNDVLAVLTQYGKNVMKDGRAGALISACKAGKVEELTALLDYLEIASAGTCGRMLSAAVAQSRTAVVSFLLERFAKVGLITRDMLSRCLTLTITNHDEECARILREGGATRDPAAVMRAIKAGTPASSIVLIKAGYAVHGRYLLERVTALHLAVEAGFDRVVEALLDAGADPNTMDGRGSTALHRAAATGQKGCCRMLLAHARTDVLARDRQRKTALKTAAEKGQWGVAGLIRRRMQETLAEVTEVEGKNEADGVHCKSKAEDIAEALADVADMPCDEATD